MKAAHVMNFQIQYCHTAEFCKYQSISQSRDNLNLAIVCLQAPLLRPKENTWNYHGASEWKVLCYRGGRLPCFMGRSASAFQQLHSHGTVRDPSSDKYSHLKKLDKASENLKLFKADLLNYDSLRAAIEGCDGVFHVASPVPSSSVSNPEVALMELAVKGTLNVLKASLEAKVKRVVFVSSITAVAVNPGLVEGQVLDETCWSDKEYCRKTENWYCLSKTEAESEAWEYAKRTGIDLVTVCPTLTDAMPIEFGETLLCVLA